MTSHMTAETPYFSLIKRKAVQRRGPTVNWGEGFGVFFIIDFFWNLPIIYFVFIVKWNLP